MSDRCVSCGMPIVWAMTPLGKKMPVDEGPNTAGNLSLLWRQGAWHVERWSVTRDGGPRYRSHFASCPHAKKHRKDARAAQRKR